MEFVLAEVYTGIMLTKYKLKYGDDEDQIIFPAPKSYRKKIFRFKRIFGEDANQKQIFETVAKPVIKNVFEGYNGTIFTYGQTGTGKTHTMTGSLEDWADTGLIPRTIEEIFRTKDSDTVISISFFEIYNEHIYDLISADQFDSKEKNWVLVEEPRAIANFRNLRVHIVRSAFETLALFKRGDANKALAETSSNSRSSRSHVIFSIGFEFPHPKEEMVSLKPVLYFVDLAGSERMTNYETPMPNIWETRSINLSLHYLEEVLVALRQPGRVHIPYRNSVMTTLLRNSLGGNCITVMIATFSMCVYNIEKTIQTCKFAERIALIKNKLKINELTTPQKEMKLLRRENERLKTQLQLICKDQILEQLTEKDKEKCKEMVQNFLKDNDFFSLPLTDVRRMEFCFYLMRDAVLRKKKSGKNPTQSPSDTVTVMESDMCSVQRELTEDSVDVGEGVLFVEDNDDNKNNICFVSNSAVVERNVRRKRNTMEIPKINIIYKRWKSTEQLAEKETASSKTAITKANPQAIYLQAGNKTEVEESKSEDFLQEKNITPNPRNSNSGQKLSSESKKENINYMNDSGSNNTDVVSKEKAINQEQPLKRCTRGEESDKCVSTGAQMEDKVDNVKNTELLDSKSLHGKDQSSTVCVPLTGDEEVDEEILKFYESRYKIFKDK